jgi:hypothetical protein
MRGRGAGEEALRYEIFRYFARIGPDRGAVRYCIAGDTASVLDCPRSRPIGAAVCVGCNRRGPSLWRLTVHGAELPQLFIIVDRKFRPVNGGRRKPHG